VTGGGIYPIERLHEAARAFSRSLVAFDALALAREHRSEANAVLLGALAGSALCRSARRVPAGDPRQGVQVDANLRGFEPGSRRRARSGARRPGSSRNASEPDVARMAESFPGELRPILYPALTRLIDYQGRAYAEQYLRRLRPFVQRGHLELARTSPATSRCG